MSKTAKEALDVLRAGNESYINAETMSGDVSKRTRERTSREGQSPYAVIVTCSDSRVIPEAIFSAGIGDLFVIRAAGNVVDEVVTGSVEYAVEHLGCGLVVVLGHTHCGAVDAALHHAPEGHVRAITDRIKGAIGDEKDADAACRLNVENSVRELQNANIAGAEIVGAVYDIESGRVRFM